MIGTAKRRYGIDFSAETSETDIELWCYRHQDRVLACNGLVRGQAYHLERAMRLLYDSEALVWHPWMDEYIAIWCDNRFATILGSAACGKSNSLGAIVLADWFAAPTETLTFVCSTTKQMLEIRIWESVVRYFQHAQRRVGVPGVISKVRTAIVNLADEAGQTASAEVKAGIKGVAVQQGSEQEAVANLVGAHLPYVRLVVDEMQSTRSAAVKARHNLSKGCMDFKFIGMGNPGPLPANDLLVQHSKPVNGWSSVDLFTHRWETRYGRSYHFDGYQSPAVTVPGGKDRYPFLINWDQIQHEVREAGNEDDPYVWQNCRGWPMSGGLDNTVLSQLMAEKHGCYGSVEWLTPPTPVLALDPAFTSGGDRCILTPLLCGVGSFAGPDGKTLIGRVIQFQKPEKIPISASLGETVSGQIGRYVIERAKQLGVKSYRIGVDESGTQTVGDTIELLGGPKVHRVNFGGKASELPVSITSAKIGTDVYSNRVTELWYAMRQFAMHGQIKAIPTEVISDTSTRMIKSYRPFRLESKTDMKARGLASPDYGDSAAVGFDVVRTQIGWIPGDLAPAEKIPPGLAEAIRRRPYQDQVFSGAPGYEQDIFAHHEQAYAEAW